MNNCSNCGKALIKNFIIYDENHFCNNLCRYSWIKKQGNNNNTGNKIENPFFLENLNFTIKHENFQNNELILKASYWFKAQIFQNKQKIKPVQKLFWKRTRIYEVFDDKGQNNILKIRFRPLDAIPDITLNEREIIIFEKLKYYEYIWISIPAIIFILGGVIGGVIGGATVFTNSIILRKVRNKIGKYLFSLVNIVAAFYLYFQIAAMINPYVLNFQRETNFEEIVKQFPEYQWLVKKSWQLTMLTDLQGNDVTNKTKSPYLDIFTFKKNGEITRLTSDGQLSTSVWEINRESKILKIQDPETTVEFKVISINEMELVLQYQNVNFVFKRKD